MIFGNDPLLGPGLLRVQPRRRSRSIDFHIADLGGITLDPASPSHLWIVDNGTDRVYQYDNAVVRTNGSQAASGSFALDTAAGNTNPQGIADPPVAGEAPFTAAVNSPSPRLAGQLVDAAMVAEQEKSRISITHPPARVSLAASTNVAGRWRRIGAEEEWIVPAKEEQNIDADRVEAVDSVLEDILPELDLFSGVRK